MNFVLAVVSFCLMNSPGQCESHQLKVEPKACSISSFLGEYPVNGNWEKVRVSIKCKR